MIRMETEKLSFTVPQAIFFGGISGNQWEFPSNFAPYAVRNTYSKVVSYASLHRRPHRVSDGHESVPVSELQQGIEQRYLPAAESDRGF